MLHKFHNKAISSSWAHFGHDSHTNQKEMIFLILQIPLGSGRSWHILHWMQVPPELLRSSPNLCRLRSSQGGFLRFFEMYIAPTSNILSSWDCLSSHFGIFWGHSGASHCRVGPEGVNQLPLGQDLLKPDTLTWMEAVSNVEGDLVLWLVQPPLFILTYKTRTSVLMSLADLKEQVEENTVLRCIYSDQCEQKNTVHTPTAAPLVKPGWPRMSSGSPCARGMAVATGISPSTTLWWTNIAIENGPFIVDFPIKKWWFSIAMLVHQMVILT